MPPQERACLPAGEKVTTKSSEPAIRDFTLRRGIWVAGHVTETGTDKRVDGEVTYNAFGDNPHSKEYPGFWGFRGQYGCQPDENGDYRIAVLPGSGIIGFLTPDDRFRRGAGAETITHPSVNEDGENRMYSTVPYFLSTANKSVVRQIDLAPDAADVTVDLSLTPGVSFTGRVLDTEGKPVAGGVVCGNEMNELWREFDGETFEVKAYYPDQPRDLYVFQPDRNLAGFYRLSGKSPPALTITLQPAGSVRRRAINDSGDPAANMGLIGHAITYSKLGKWDLRYSTDEDGRFHIRGLAAGQKYTVHVRDGNYDRGRAFVDLSVEAGETHDLGDVRLTFPAPKETTKTIAPDKKTAASAAAPAGESIASGEESLPTSQKPLVITGQVLDPDGRPVSVPRLRCRGIVGITCVRDRLPIGRRPTPMETSSSTRATRKAPAANRAIGGFWRDWSLTPPATAWPAFPTARSGPTIAP